MIILNVSKNKILLSLIIPVYNVEIFIEKALTSVENQTMKNFEVIIVNDGSTDKSLEVIQSFIKKHNHFHLINQKNSGLSAARNNGLKRARGDYVVFMDSDDFIEPTYLEDLYNACVKNNADVSYCAYYTHFHDINFRIYIPIISKSDVFAKKIALRRLIRDVSLHYFAWNKCFKRSLFYDNNIEFPDMYFEDIATTPRLFFYSNKVAILSKGLYNYTKRKGSILQSMNVNKINDYIKAYAINRNFLEKNNAFDDYKLSFKIFGYRMMLCNYYSIIRIHFICRNFKGFMKNIKNSNYSISYFQGDKFQVFNENSQILPKPIKMPKNKSKKGESLAL